MTTQNRLRASQAHVCAAGVAALPPALQRTRTMCAPKSVSHCWPCKTKLGLHHRADITAADQPVSVAGDRRRCKDHINTHSASTLSHTCRPRPTAPLRLAPSYRQPASPKAKDNSEATQVTGAPNMISCAVSWVCFNNKMRA